MRNLIQFLFRTVANGEARGEEREIGQGLVALSRCTSFLNV